MSQRPYSPSSSDNDASGRPSQRLALPPVPAISRNTTNSRARRIGARCSAFRIPLPSPSPSEVTAAETTVVPSVAAQRWVPRPLASSSSRVNYLIGNLIDTARDSADVHQQHADTDRPTESWMPVSLCLSTRSTASSATWTTWSGRWRIGCVTKPKRLPKMNCSACGRLFFISPIESVILTGRFRAWWLRLG